MYKKKTVLIEINVSVETKIYITCWQSVLHSFTRGTNFWQKCLLPSLILQGGKAQAAKGGGGNRRRGTKVVMKTIYMEVE